MKGRAAALCKDLELSKLASSITGCRKKDLTVFFTAKTHKDSVPFRTIVSEKGSWQCLISHFLQKHLSALHVDDPFATKNSSELVGLLNSNVHVGYAFSIDVEDLFYSVPHGELFVAVRNCIETNGVIGFQNTAGVSVDSFMSLLEFYLKSTFISFNDDFYIQRKGICIGSCVALVLCDISIFSRD